MAPFPPRHSPAKSVPLLAALSALALASCSASPGAAPPSSSAPPTGVSPSASASTTPAPPLASPSPDPGLRPLGWGPEQRDQDAAAAAVAAMSAEQKAGQVLLPVYAGTDAEAQAATVEHLHLAGSIIMGDNVPLDARGQADPPAMAAVNARLA